MIFTTFKTAIIFRIKNSLLSRKTNCFRHESFYPVVKSFIYLLLFSQIIWAQYRFDSFTTDNGLPQNGVRGIEQTPDGYLWFTTFDGLVRFDGVNFTVFDKNNSEGILSNRFFLLYEDEDGALIAGTESDGLTVYRSGVFKSFTTCRRIAFQ